MKEEGLLQPAAPLHEYIHSLICTQPNSATRMGLLLLLSSLHHKLNAIHCDIYEIVERHWLEIAYISVEVWTSNACDVSTDHGMSYSGKGN